MAFQPRRGLNQLSDAQLNAERRVGGGPAKPTVPTTARLPLAPRPGGKLGEGAARASLSTWRASSHGGSGVGTRVRGGGTAVRRARSLSLSPHPFPPRQDPRAEKPFTEACCQSVIAYVVTKGYKAPISPATLKNNASFCEVVAFLARKVDPGAPALTLAHFVEEVPALFRRLRYPFPLQKSALLAVGSPGTWPAVMAALAWLVELLRYDESAQTAAPVALDAVAPEAGRPFFALCASSYTHFLSGDDDRVDELDEELERSQEAADGRAAGRERALAAQALELDARIAARREASAAAQIRGAEQQGAALRLRCGEAEARVVAAKEGKECIVTQHAERLAEERRLDEELRAAREEKATLQRSVAGQEKSASEVASLRSEAQQQEAELERVREQALLAEERCGAAEATSGEACGAALALLETYSASCTALQTLPATAKRAQGGAFVLHLQLGQGSVPSVPELQAALGQLRSGVRPGLEGIRDEYRQRWGEAGVARLRLDAELDTSEAALGEQRKVLREVEGNLRSTEAILAEKREALRASADDAEQEARTLEAATAEARQAGEARQASSERELQQLHKQHDELAARCAAEAALTQQNVLAALDLMMAHKQAVQDALDGCGRVLDSLCADLAPDAGIA